MTASDKHSSLLRQFVNYGNKEFYNSGPRMKKPDMDEHTLTDLGWTSVAHIEIEQWHLLLWTNQINIL